MRNHSAEVEYWKPLALKLVTTSDLIRSRQTTRYHWRQVATSIVGDYPGEIAEAIFGEQATRESDIWFAKHSPAKDVLIACAEHNPGRVWQSLQPYISSAADAFLFGIGFPQGVLERMPQSELWAWIAEDPEERATIVARLANKDMSTDETLTSRLLGEYGDNESVASALYCDYASGTWWGPASTHWDELADKLDAVAARTALSKLRHWASNSARSLRAMAQRDRQREEEDDLRGR
jgi:hypothetical protein